MDIQALRKMRNTDFGKITAEFDKIANPESGGTKSYKDDRIWKLEADKAGNGTATLRFLPRVEGDELPWVKIFTHGFQGPTGKWYLENSLTTLGENDPVGELNSKLWNSGSDANKEIARKQKRKLSYICNVLIISDPKHPENEGKVMLFKFGKKIFDKLMDKAKPTFEDDKPVNIFDPYDGADFKLRMRKVDGYPNYDQSTFMDQAQLAGGDEEKMVEILNRSYKLSEFLDRKNFKSYEDLNKKLSDVLDADAPLARSAATLSEDDSYVAPTRNASAPTQVASRPVSVSSSNDEEDVMKYFQKIADEA
jgi:hypothetical protein